MTIFGLCGIIYQLFLCFWGYSVRIKNFLPNSAILLLLVVFSLCFTACEEIENMDINTEIITDNTNYDTESEEYSDINHNTETSNHSNITNNSDTQLSKCLLCFEHVSRDTTLYCSSHACLYWDCPYPAKSSGSGAWGSHCAIHGCAVPDCLNYPIGGSYFCASHQ